MRKPLVHHCVGMTNETYKQVRTLNLHFGRLSAIKYLRSVRGISFEAARLAVEDITTNKRWTKPEIQADLNCWEQGYEVSL